MMNYIELEKMMDAVFELKEIENTLYNINTEETAKTLTALNSTINELETAILKNLNEKEYSYLLREFKELVDDNTDVPDFITDYICHNSINLNYDELTLDERIKLKEETYNETLRDIYRVVIENNFASDDENDIAYSFIKHRPKTEIYAFALLYCN